MNARVRLRNAIYDALYPYVGREFIVGTYGKMVDDATGAVMKVLNEYGDVNAS